MKNVRQQKILEIIQRYDVDTQDALIQRLADIGIAATQTTVSRDIRQLQLVKQMTQAGTYKYAVGNAKRDTAQQIVSSSITDSVVKITAARNIVVIKTYPGMANALAVFVDSLEQEHIIGTVAGDDTILLVASDDETATLVVEHLKKKFAR